MTRKGRPGIRHGILRRILPYATKYRRSIAVLLLATVTEAVITASTPLLLKAVIDEGILPGRADTVLWLSGALAAATLLQAGAMYLDAWASGRIGEGVVFDLRHRIFTHVQKQPLAFFTRTQTGALVSRLNGDVIGARDALTSLLSQTVSTLLTLALVLSAMFYLSWQISVVAVLAIPVFLLPARLVIGKVQRLTRERMGLDAEMSSLMNERFNVSGAMLAKLYGRPEDESRLFSGKADRIRNVSVVAGLYGQLPWIILTLLATFTTAAVYGLGGRLAIGGTLQLGTLVAMGALLVRLYEPIDRLSMLQTTAAATVVSFERVFEVLDLDPLVDEEPGARALPPSDGTEAPEVVFEGVGFRYPAAHEVSLASLETTARPEEPTHTSNVLEDLTFHAPAGRLTALVGPSGAGKTTITYLLPRLYDPTHGTIRIGGHDIRTLTRQSLTDTVGVVTQDAHLFHDTLRANLTYAKPDATQEELVQACRTALIWNTIDKLPHGLDTVVGDRGHHLSGGEKQRISIARLLLKAPPVVILDEATAHLDSESEAAIQQALDTALAGRTSLVIAHRLSTIRRADQILVINNGRIHEHGTHHQLLTTGGLYADLYHTQYAPQEENEEDLVPGVAPY